MNKPVYLCLSVLDITKTAMYEYWYDYEKLNYEDRVKLCNRVQHSFIVHVKSKTFMQILQQMLRQDLIQ